MAQLAIKGHPTRGKEVIESLEMLGGENEYKLNGCNIECAYYKKNGVIHNTSPVGFNNIKLFPLEKFLEKFPYKVGDKVKYVKYNDEYPSVYTIQGMRWTGTTIEYLLNSSGFSALTKDLQPYKEETMEERKYADLRLDVDQDDKLATEVTIDGYKITLPENYLIGKITKVDDGMLVEFVKKQPQYPKTYEECAKELGYNQVMPTDHILGYKGTLLSFFQELLICRDAYWKIAGEQMGLDKPWKPDYNEESYEQGSPIKYVIYYTGTHITKGQKCTPSYILTFHTEEMREAFYENFKDLIELCKELL